MTERLTRRAMIRNLLGAAAAGVTSRAVFSAQGDPERGRERQEMNRLAGDFRRTFSVPGLSIAIARNGKFVYDHVVGMADIEKSVQAEQTSLFRIASVTKPITAVTIFSLIQNGKLSLNEKVFGPSGILGTKYGKTPYKQYVTDVTVDHLLTHTAGGWQDDATDPMYQHGSWDQEKLISWVIEDLPLADPPGQHWAYSNFGYCVLGRVIEQVTGQPYAAYVQNNILAPCSITDMQIARNKQHQHYPNEVVYYGQFGEDPYKINVERMDSDSGWIASASDLVQFLNHIGGFANNAPLLKPETIHLMTTPAPVFPEDAPVKYARGWKVRSDGQGGWWHNGSLPGTTSIMMRTNTGMCCAALANTRTEPHNQMDAALEQLLWDMVRIVPEWAA